MRKKILLVGGGYAHLLFLKRFKEKPIDDTEVTILAGEAQYDCPELIPRWIEGSLEADEIRIDTERLAGETGAGFIKGEALSVDLKQKMVLTSEGDILSFDVVSFDHRQRYSIPFPDLESERVIVPSQMTPVRLEKQSVDGEVVVVGGGVLGVETAIAIQNRKKGEGAVTWVESDGHVRSEVKGVMRKAGIRIIPNGKSLEWTSKTPKVDGASDPFDVLWTMCATGPRGFYKSSKLPVDERGYLIVEDTLQVKKFPFVFGCGIDVVINGHPDWNIDRTAWVKQGETLFDNINGYLNNGEGYHYHPPRIKNIISIRDKKAFLFVGPFRFTGALPRWMKDQSDYNFMSLFR